MKSSRFFRGFGVLAGLLIVVSVVRLPGLYSRAIWYDEAFSLLETAGHAFPAWPRAPAPASLAQQQFEGAPTLGQITELLRGSDVHPPLYYWILSLWRRWLGFSLETARALSLIFSVSGVFVLYLLLRAGRIPFPAIPTLFFGLTTFGVYMGHEARAYSFTLFLVLSAALLAYLSVDVGGQNKLRAAGYGVLAGLCCGAALAVNYLALFPAIAILIWLLIYARSVSRWLASLPALITAAIGLLVLTMLSNQIGARPSQFAGRPELLQQLSLLAWMNLSNLHTSIIPSKTLQYVLWGTLCLMGVFTFVRVANRWSDMEHRERRLLVLVLLLGLAPSVGIALLNLLFDKNLGAGRYIAFALPSLSVAVSYGITTLMCSKRSLGVGLLLMLLLLQLSGINWGLEWTPGQGGSATRSLARVIEASPSPSRLIVVGAGFGRGHPGTVIYELDPGTEVVVLYRESDLDQLQDRVSDYAEVCLFLSMEPFTSDVENEFLQRLRGEEIYTEVIHNSATLCLRKVEPSSWLRGTGAAAPPTTIGLE